jgi:hypothetical protein
VHYGQGIGAILGAPFLSYKQLSFGVSFRAIYIPSIYLVPLCNESLYSVRSGPRSRVQASSVGCHGRCESEIGILSPGGDPDSDHSLDCHIASVIFPVPYARIKTESRSSSLRFPTHCLSHR